MNEDAAQLVSDEVNEVLEWVKLEQLLSRRTNTPMFGEEMVIQQQTCALFQMMPHENLVQIIRMACCDGDQINWVQLLRWCTTCRDVFSIAVLIAREDRNGAQTPSCKFYGGRDSCDISMHETHELVSKDTGKDTLLEQRLTRSNFLQLLLKEGNPTPRSSVQVTSRVERIFEHAREAYELHYEDESADLHGTYDEDNHFADGLERWLSFWLLKQGMRFVAILTELDVPGEFKHYYEKSSFEWSSRKRGIFLCGRGCAPLSEARFAEVLAAAQFDIDEGLREYWRQEELEDLRRDDSDDDYHYGRRYGNYSDSDEESD